MKIVSTFIGLLIAICPSLLAQPSSAVASIHGHGGVRGVSHTAVISFSEHILYSAQYPIFDALTLTTNDVGRLFTYTHADDPDFDSMVGILTDGVAESIGYSISLPPVLGSAGQWGGESTFFSQLPVGGNGIDFKGFQIDSIALRLDQLSFSSPGTNPGGDGIWTDYSFSGEIVVNYEPVTLTIQLSGGNVILSWTNSTFALQSAPTINGIFTNIPGATSPSTNLVTGLQRYFRLKTKSK